MSSTARNGRPGRRVPQGRRAAIYHRVSTLDQDPTAARGELIRAAKQRGYLVVLNVEETASGTIATRPGLMKVLTAADKGEIDCLLVWKLDRFGRGAIDLLTNVSGCGRQACALSLQRIETLRSASVEEAAPIQAGFRSGDNDKECTTLYRRIAFRLARQRGE